MRALRARGPARDPRPCGAPAGAHLGGVRRLHHHLGARERPRGLTALGGAPGRARAAPGAASPPPDGAGGSLGDLRVPDQCRRAGGRDAARSVTPSSIFGAVLLDWDRECERMGRIAAIFDAAEEVRIVGPATDLTLSLAGPQGAIDDGHINMPGGEVFYSPLEDSACGEISFSEFPAALLRPRGQRRAPGVRRRTRRGRGGLERRGLPARDARHRSRRAQAGRARDRLQPRDPALHPQRRLRREDRRHDPSRARQLLHLDRWCEPKLDPLGHRQGPPRRGAALRRRRARPGGRPLGFCTPVAPPTGTATGRGVGSRGGERNLARQARVSRSRARGSRASVSPALAAWSRPSTKGVTA